MVSERWRWKSSRRGWVLIYGLQVMGKGRACLKVADLVMGMVEMGLGTEKVQVELGWWEVAGR